MILDDGEQTLGDTPDFSFAVLDFLRWLGRLKFGQGGDTVQ
jgi:hypothetical protein